MRKFLAILILLVAGQLAIAQNPARDFKSFSEKKNYFEIQVSDGIYRLQFFTPEILEASFIPQGEEYTDRSHAVVMDPDQVRTELSHTDECIKISTEAISVQIQKNPFQLSYYQGEKIIVSEAMGYMDDSLETIQFNLTEKEALYGAGARALGMNRRGYRLQLYNRAHYGYETHSELMNYTMPIVLSSKQYMLHFDNPATGFLDLDSKGNNLLAYETISGRKTYQVIAGNSWLDIIDNYTKLTGRQPLPPRWTLGNFSSRFGYHSQEETLETIEKFKQEEIPVDAIILDLYWFGKDIKGTMGNLEFYKDSFPHPQKMIDSLRSQNIETILITEPFILTTSNRWDEAVREDILAKDSTGEIHTYDFYFGHTGLIDIFDEKAYNWFKDIYKDLLGMGVTGMWGDLGEPEVHPSVLRHGDGRTADEVHNIYGHVWTKLVNDAYQEYNSNMRPFILMRAGYSGTQRFGILPWSGDVNRTWGGLKSQPEIALQMGMQGIGYMHSDLGGFAGANLDDELYVRWLQYGVFQPVYRPHAQEEVPSEPVFRSEKAMKLSKQAIELRYRMLPYNYNLVYQNHTTGAPFMRPLMFEEPENEELYDYTATYLWGDDFLIAPILKKGKNKKEVYFPKTANWFDFYTGEKYKGGQYQKVKVKEESIPAFVRAGAFIPMAEPIQTTKEYNGSELVLHYYFDPEIEGSASKLYHDNGKTVNAIEKGMYELMHFNSEIEDETLTITLEAETGSNYNTSEKKMRLEIYNVQNDPVSLKANGKKCLYGWNETEKYLAVPFIWDTKESFEIVIKIDNTEKN